MSTGDWIAVVSAVAAVLSVVFALWALYVSTRHVQYGYLAELMREYGEPGMREAVKRLWDFWRRHDEDAEKVKAAFTQTLEESSGDHDALDSSRRGVSHFYQRMAALYEGGLLPSKVLYRIWLRETLVIIPKIIVPLEEALYRHIRGKEPTTQFDYLRKLYNDSPNA